MPSEREKIEAAIKAQAIIFARMVAQKQVPDSAVEDFMARAFTEFDGQHCDALAARQWADRLSQGGAPHLFAQTAPAPAATAQGTVPAALVEQWNRLPVAERMTKAREYEAAQGAKR